MRHAASCALVIALTACASHARPYAGAPLQAGAKELESSRDTIPVTGSQPTLLAPVPEHTQLANGLTLYVVPKRDLPLVQFTLVIKTGAAADPVAIPGLASLTGELVKRGTQGRTADAIADQIETLGGALEVQVSEDETTLATAALSANRQALLDILADITMRPAFSAQETNRAKKQRLAGLMQAETEPSAVARRVFRQIIYSEHAYGHMPHGTAQGIAKVTPTAAKAFWTNHYRPANAALIVVGDVDPATVRGEIEALFGGWKGRPGVDPAPKNPRIVEPEVALVDRPGASQSQIMIGGVGLARNTEDFFPAILCNAILGGMFNSRINMNLREAKGWTYGARSAFSFLRAPGPQVVSAGIRTDATAPAISETLREVEAMRQEGVTPEELQAAKSSYSLSLPGNFQTIGALANMVAALYVYDLPLDYYRRLPEHLEAVTLDDVRRVAQTYLDPKHMSIVVVGDSKEVATSLAGLHRGPLVHRNVHGKRAKKALMTRAAPAKAAVPAQTSDTTH